MLCEHEREKKTIESLTLERGLGALVHPVRIFSSVSLNSL